MGRRFSKELRVLELSLIIVTVGLTALLWQFQGHKMVVLNLFFLPIVLMGFYLGRYRAGILALFCVIAASVIAMLDLESLASYTSPLVMTLSIAVWGAVLGMTALLVGTLSDERQRTLNDLHEAYVGVVEVLSQYLQGGHPRLKARSIRMAELSQRVAEQLKLPSKQVDDIRVAALLYDMGDIEITAKVIRRAVGTLEEDSTALSQYTFQGRDFVLSLGPVISGAMPLLLGCEGLAPEAESQGKAKGCQEPPIGARIIRTVRDYTALTLGETGRPKLTAQEALDEMRRDSSAEYDAQVLNALEQLIGAHEVVDEEDPHLINA